MDIVGTCIKAEHAGKSNIKHVCLTSQNILMVSNEDGKERMTFYTWYSCSRLVTTP